MTLDRWTVTPIEGMTVRRTNGDVYPGTGVVVRRDIGPGRPKAIVLWEDRVTTLDLLTSLTPVEAELTREPTCPVCGDTAEWCPELRAGRV
jgi:hypothetical protein